MALDARTRSSIYGKFAEILGDHDANALMSEFPSAEADELVTKQFLRAELGSLRFELRDEINGLRSELRDEINGLRSELRDEMDGLRSELRDEMNGLRGEMNQLGSELRGEMNQLGSELRGEMGALGSELRLEMVERFHRQTIWLVGTVVAAVGAIITAMPLLS